MIKLKKTMKKKQYKTQIITKNETEKNETRTKKYKRSEQERWEITGVFIGSYERGGECTDEGGEGNGVGVTVMGERVMDCRGCQGRDERGSGLCVSWRAKGQSHLHVCLLFVRGAFTLLFM